MFCSIIAALTLKEVAMAMLNFLRMRFSTFGAGTKIKLNGEVYLLHRIDYTYVEFNHISKKKTIYMPISKFLRMDKEILFNGEE
jgi:hypothetical protein